MKTLLRKFSLVLPLLPLAALLLGASFSGTSMVGPGGISPGLAAATYLKLDASNDPLTGALSSSNGTFGTSGTTTALTLESTLAATAGVDVGMILRSTADLAAADTAFSFRDNTSTQLLKIDGVGNLTATSGVVATDRVYSPSYSDITGAIRLAVSLDSPNTYTSTDDADGSMVAHVFDTVDLAATTDKLFSVKNQGVETMYITPAGILYSAALVGGLTSAGYVYAQHFTNGTGIAGMRVQASDTVLHTSDEVDGASAIGFSFNTTNTMTTTAKLLSIQNATVEKVSIDSTGRLETAGLIQAQQFNATGSNISFTTTYSQTGLNATLASGANAAGEYGVVVGTNAVSTAHVGFAVASDIDGTPNYVFAVDGLGNTAIGGSLTAGQGTRLEFAGAVTPAAGGAYGMMMAALSLDPPDGSSANMLEISPYITADAGETHPGIYGISIPSYTKMGSGTVTTAVGLFVAEPTIGGTNNYAIQISGAPGEINYAAAGLITSNSSDAGLNIALYSAANDVTEYGVVVGSSAATTAQKSFAVCNDCDGTPVYVFEVDGLGNLQLDGVIKDVDGTTRMAMTTVGSTTFTSPVTDGASAIGHIFDTTSTLTTTAKLASFKNAGVERAALYNSGTLQIDGALVSESGGVSTFAGRIQVADGLDFNTTAAQPVCAVGLRGLLWTIEGGAGVADKLEQCMKGTADTYAWTTIATAP